MTAKVRVAIAVLVTGLVLGSAPAHAQDAAAPATTNSTDAVGPRELQDFNLQGTVTRPAEPQPRPAPPVTSAPAPRPSTRPSTTPPATTAPSARETTAPSERPTPREPAPARVESPSPAVAMQMPPLGDSPTDSAVRDNPPAPVSNMPATGSDVPWPWLLASIMLLAGAGAYFWRQRRREALAGARDDAFDAYEGPSPPAAAKPVPALQRAVPEPDPIGIVSTRLRPWLELAFRPTGCKIDEENVTFEFELGLFNSGSTPARAILVEASYFNAGETQEQEIERFFANPVGAGDRAVSLAPLKKMVISTKVITPRAQVREYEVGGRKVFVPLLGFNALYSWATGQGQTSASFIVGRATRSEKLAPFRLDMLDKEFHALGQRPLPATIRQ